MMLYLAPLEGITGWIYRNAVCQCFGGFDKYFIPFIRPNQMGHLSSREKKDIDPEHNRGMNAVPQILTNKAEDFIRTAKKLQQYGYTEVNLNLGCPSKTVVTKGRGAGFLADPDGLQYFLEEIFSRTPMKISVKTRIGMSDPKEFGCLLKIYSAYPLAELILHPRLQTDYYKNGVNFEAYRDALDYLKCPVCYNGDIYSSSDFEKLKKDFPETKRVMLGRGVLSDPSLARSIRGGEHASAEELKAFHDLVYEGYKEEMSGERTVLFKMKELWHYLSFLFPDSKKNLKKIKKAEKCIVYEDAVNEIFSERMIFDD